MSEPPHQASPPPRHTILRRADQAVVAVLVLSALGSMAAYWFWQGGWNGRLVELDRQPRRTARFVVDINQADWPELAQLPGVGETLGRRIVESRNAAGPFMDHDDITRVRGIGPRTLERIRPYLRPMPASDAVAGP